jgi:hypothetical protein
VVVETVMEVVVIVIMPTVVVVSSVVFVLMCHLETPCCEKALYGPDLSWSYL